MEIPVIVDIDSDPVAIKSYSNISTREYVVEKLYVMDEPERFVGCHLRRTYGAGDTFKDEYLQEAFIGRVRKGTVRYDNLRAWMEATAPEERIPDDVDFMPIFGIGENPPKRILWFTQDRFDFYRSEFREYIASVLAEF